MALLFCWLVVKPVSANLGDVIFARSDGGYRAQLDCCTSGLQLSIDEANFVMNVDGYWLDCPDPNTCSAGFRTGPLIGNTSNSWTFAGGGSFDILSDLGLLAEFPFPPACTLQTSQGNSCYTPPGGFNGTFSGVVTMTSVFDGFTITGPVDFRLNPAIATFWG